MDELELSVMSYDASAQDLHTVLQEFEAQHRVRVQIQQLSWETSWTEITKYALYGHGPAVSEIGSTWVASLALMNALRPFTAQDVAALGGPATYLPAAWHSGVLPDSSTIWAAPWLSETRVIFYRRDWLKAAGVDEQTAFRTQADLEQTLERLRANGVAAPWVVPTRQTLTTFHNVTSWVWGAGGDFVDERRWRVTFAEPEAVAGLRAYYSLHHFLPADARQLDTSQVETLFVSGKAAATLSGPWLMQGLPSELRAQMGVALPPGVPFISESHLVIWRSVPPRLERLAFELVRFLTSKKTQLMCSQQVGLMPVRLEALSSAPFTTDPLYQTLAQGLTAGRSFPAMRLWGLVEDKLSAALGNLWAKVLAAPNPDLDFLIHAELEPLARRLNATLTDSAERA
jgi:multiple sugar transport system substrate-binding protein